MEGPGKDHLSNTGRFERWDSRVRERITGNAGRGAIPRPVMKETTSVSGVSLLVCERREYR